MSLTLREIRDKLLAGDAEFRSLADEHSRYEEQLDQLYKAPYVNAEAILLEADLKKKKLRVKDEMQKRLDLVSKSTLTH